MPYKTHKIALAPTFRERRWFAQQCGYARFAYNHALSDFKAGLENDNFQSWRTLNNNFNQTKKEYDWTALMDQRAALYAIKHLGQGIANWVSKRAKFPKFKIVATNRVGQQMNNPCELKASVSDYPR